MRAFWTTAISVANAILTLNSMNTQLPQGPGIGGSISEYLEYIGQLTDFQLTSIGQMPLEHAVLAMEGALLDIRQLMNFQTPPASYFVQDNCTL